MPRTIHIAMLSDENYAQPLLTAMASILLSAAPEDALAFHLVDCGLHEEDRLAITALKRIAPFAVRFIAPDPAELRSFPAHRCAPCAYYKSRLPDMLPELDQVLYLDCDLLATRSLGELWETELGDAPAAAARDFIDYVKDELKNFHHLTGFGFNPHTTYFNSGVLLLNLAKLRAEHFSTLFFTTRAALAGRIKFSDQDVLNRLFQGNALIVDQKWNFQAPLFLLDTKKMNPDEAELAIIHYTTQAKPWIDGSLCILGDEYARVAGLVASLTGRRQGGVG